jgi:universal stress protein A
VSDYHHILIATDLSPASLGIGKKAMHIGQHNNAKVSIVNVINFPPTLYGSGEFAIPLDTDLEENLREQAEKDLASQSSELGISKENQYILEGSTNNEIVHLAEELAIDLIVVGSHDQHGLALLFGSTANAILHAMPCDILAVKVEHHK